MFLAKSVFWLGLAYVVIHPGLGDLASATQVASEQASVIGRQAVAEGLRHCGYADCAGPALSALAAAAPALAAVQPARTGPVAPIPQPRPQRLG